ncbi:MAG: glycosyltransferase family 4 protein, partial [Actinobacteria bacterium]|nr:glycosyltransferase family 4 protein [Actinomycetota bacterium]
MSSLGGGERYLFAAADVLRSTGYAVELAAPEVPTRRALEALGFHTTDPIRRLGKWQYIAASARYDLAVCLTNDPPPPSLARRSIAVVQFPMHGLSSLPPRRMAERVALRRYQCVVYSEYVLSWVKQRWAVDATVIHPPIEQGHYDAGAKRPMILSVGRFFAAQHSKRQDVLVRAFGRVAEQLGGAWRLVLAGVVAERAADRAFLDDVRRAADGLPVDIEIDVAPDRLAQLYTEASLYWHGAGYGRTADEPEKAEHFGMTTVEAMSYGAVPLVYDDGGQREIVTDDVGVRWTTVDELVDATTQLAADAGARGQ